MLLRYFHDSNLGTIPGVVIDYTIYPLLRPTSGEPLDPIAATQAELLGAVDAALQESGHPAADADIVAFPITEIWAAGVTYKRSMEARMEESTQKDVYDTVYDADRPEIFAKSWRGARTEGEPITIRSDSTWDVPEPELTLLINSHGEIIGYGIGNDVSSRSIEGENPLYLPQAKIWDGSAAVSPMFRIATPDFDPLALTITLTISRDGAVAFEGSTHTSSIHRSLTDLVTWLHRGSTFPHGVALMTGTGIVPPDEFTLKAGDTVAITIDQIGTLTNPVQVLDINSNSVR